MRTVLAIAVALAVLGCQAQAPGAVGAKRKPAAHATPSPVAASGSDEGGGGGPGGGPGGGSTPAPDPTAAPGGTPAPAAITLAGRLLLPASLISDRGLGVVSNNGGTLVANHGSGYRLLAAQEQPVAGATVTLATADGQPVRDAAGRPITATTDAAGRYAFTAPLPAGALVVEARGTTGDAVRGLAPKTAGGRGEVDLDLASTLTTGYILDRYVTPQADPVGTLAKLPDANERDTREAARLALENGKIPTPANLAAATIVAAAAALRAADPGFDAEMERVRKLLVAAGQSDLGTGRPAREVALSRVSQIVPAPDGSVYLNCAFERRVRRVTAAGLMTTAAGKGQYAAGTLDGVAGPEAGLGEVVSISLDAAGNLLIVDAPPEGGADRVTILRADGRLHAVAGAGEATIFGPGGVPWTQDGNTLYALEAAGRRTLHAFAAGEAPNLYGAHLDAAGGLLYRGGYQDGDYSRDTIRRLDPATWTSRELWREPSDPDGSRIFDEETPFFDDAGHVLFANRWLGEETPVSLLDDAGAVRPLATLKGLDAGERDLLSLALAPDGTLYAGTLDGRAYKMPRGGVAARFAGVSEDGGGSATADGIAFGASSIAALPTGELVMTGSNPGRVVKVGADGKVVEVAKPDGSIEDLYKLGTDAAGRIYAVSYDEILRFDGTAQQSLFKAEAAGADWAGVIDWMCVGPDGTVSFQLRDLDHRYHRKIAPDGTVSDLPAGLIPASGLMNPFADKQGALYASDYEGRIFKLTTGGPQRLAPAGEAFPENTYTFAFDAKGRLYGATDTRIHRLDPATGKVVLVAGEGAPLLSGAGVDDSLDQIGDLAVNPAGDLFVNDELRKQIKKIPAASLP